MRLLAIAAALIVPFSASCSQPHGRWQPATVSQVGDRPCFSVADSEETRRSPPQVAVLDVGVYRSSGAKIIWSADFVSKNPPLTLSPGHCIVYGERGVDELGAAELYELKEGERYTFYFNSDIRSPNAGEWQNRVYEGFFCLTREAAGKILVHEVPWDKVAEKWRWDVCGLAND